MVSGGVGETSPVLHCGLAFSLVLWFWFQVIPDCSFLVPPLPSTQPCTTAFLLYNLLIFVASGHIGYLHITFQVVRRGSEEVAALLPHFSIATRRGVSHY